MDKQKEQIDETQKELDEMLASQQDEDESDDDSKKKENDEESEEEDEESEEEDDSDDESDEDSEDDDESEDDEDESEDESEDEDEEDEEDSDEDESDDDDSEDDDEDEEEDDDHPKGRKPKDGDERIPKWKMKAALKEQRRALLKDPKFIAEVAKLAKGDNTSEDGVDEDVTALVKKFGFKEDTGAEFVKELTGYISKRLGITPEFMKGMQEAKRAALDSKEQAEFDKDFRKNENLIRKLFPKLRERDLVTIKRKVRDLAYTKQYERYALSDIIRLNKGKLLVERKKGLDGSRLKVKGKVKFDLNNPGSIPFDEMSMEDFEKVSEALARKSRKNRFIKSS